MIDWFALFFVDDLIVCVAFFLMRMFALLFCLVLILGVTLFDIVSVALFMVGGMALLMVSCVTLFVVGCVTFLVVGGVALFMVMSLIHRFIVSVTFLMPEKGNAVIEIFAYRSSQRVCSYYC